MVEGGTVYYARVAKLLMVSTAALPLGFTNVQAQTPGSTATVVLPQIDVVATTPLGGGEPIEKIPAQVSTVGAPDFARTRSPNVTDALQQQIPGAVSIDTNGNPFAQDLRYRGFIASAVQGTPQGLAVYQNGIRVNEAFGDTVNFDLIPPQAIDRADLFTNNPVFGLNALGGALSLQMKNGFTWQGMQAQALGGSFGRVSGFFEYGRQIGDYSLYVTGDAARDGGWRYFSPSSVGRLYGDLGYRSTESEVHLVASGARTYLGVVGPTPVDLLAHDPRAVFTSPQTTLNEVGSLAFTGRFGISKTWSIQSNFYLRTFNQRHTDGNDAEFEECEEESGFEGQLCVDEDNFAGAGGAPNRLVLLDQSGRSIPFAGETFPYGTIDRTRTRALSAGLALQATNRDKIFDHDNFITFGGSVDRSTLSFGSTSTLGAIDPRLVVGTDGSFPGSGAKIETLGRIGYVPISLNGTTTYYGVYVLDTFNITPELAVSAGARLNIANISTTDTTGLAPELDINASYTRINPVVGATYALTPSLGLYAGYSEANRAPTPLELNCADPTRPCLLENSLVADPPLQQVVARTVEAGLRGSSVFAPDGTLAWKAGYFRTESSNDIVSLASTITGRGYFSNVPATLRQGLEANALVRWGSLAAYANYAFIDATYQFNGTLASPNNPLADENGNIFVRPGNHIPGIARHLIKFGGDYAFTPSFSAGADILVAGSQYLVGDDSNLNPKLPSYWTVNLHASYQVNENIQFFGLINNLFNNRNATYGTFFGRETSAQLATPISFTGNPRTMTPLQPLSLYGGLRVTF
jgi:iron complex outermembrane receptor protein